MSDVKCEVKDKELEVILNRISEAYNHADSMANNIENINDRLNGCAPKTACEDVQPREGVIGGIMDSIDSLNAAQSRMQSEIDKINNIV